MSGTQTATVKSKKLAIKTDVDASLTPSEFYTKYKIEKLTEYAEEIAKCSKYSNLFTVRTMLSQINSGKSKIPTDFKKAMILVINKSNKSFSKVDIENDISMAFDKTFELRRIKDKSTFKVKNINTVVNKEDLALLISSLHQAKEITLISSEPAELKNSAISDKFIEILFSNLKLNEVDFNIKNIDSKYTFIFPQTGSDIESKFWISLIAYGRRNKIHDIEKRIELLNQGDNPFIKVLVSPKFYCFDLNQCIMQDKNSNGKIGFISMYFLNPLVSKSELLKVIRIEGESLRRAIDKVNYLKESKHSTPFSFIDACAKEGLSFKI